MQIRTIEKSDAKSFFQFFSKLASQTDFLLPTQEEVAKTSLETQTQIISNLDDYKQIFIATIGDEIVGFIGITRANMSKSKHVANFAIGVLENSRRQGIAKGLLSSAEKWAKGVGIKRLELTVIVDNLPAIGFYEQAGFTKEGIRQSSIFMDNDYYDEIYMSKLI